jgi:molybdopterin converting factor small subunit
MMKIDLEFFSILSRWVGESQVAVDLPDGATYGDLLAHIGRTLGPRMPSQLWQVEENTFVRQIGAFQNGSRIESAAVALHDGDCIRFMPMMGGG